MVEWIVVGLLGAAVGVTELISRYRDEPKALLAFPGFWLYLVLNAAASLAAILADQIGRIT